MSYRTLIRTFGACTLALVALAAVIAGTPARADGGVTFTDVAAAAGIVYEQTPPARSPLRQAALDALPVTAAQFACCHRQLSPMKPRGNPGVAILDFDGDGDLDVYATNGPGTANSLFSNQLQETGSFSFVDVATAAGVDATAQESAGACFGDIDNDGDEDLYVVATGDHSNLLFENQGDGSFSDITAAAGVDGYGRWTPSCTFGDANNDGLLDLFVSATYDSWQHRDPIYVVGPHYPFFEHNILYINQGGNTFADATAAAGLDHPSNMDQPGTTGAAHTWVSAFVDLDQDGDVDILSADNQGSNPTAPEEERGYLRLYANDGAAGFEEITQAAGLDFVGSWSGLSFGDVDCDGTIDLFASNQGDYLTFGNADRRSAIWTRNADGSYTRSGPSQANPFGWGSSMFDYDNDGDTDVLYHGGIDILQLIAMDNPGVLIRNEGTCSGEFTYDTSAFSTDHRFRGVHGVATGDLNDDGFMDVVTVSNHNIVPGQPAQLPMTILTGGPLGSPFDSLSLFQLVLTGAGGMLNEINPGLQLPNGDLALEVNSGNGNGWVKVRTRGSVGTLANGAVNRDGIGAVVRFTPHQGPASTLPVLGGSSYSSQHALEIGFGLGGAEKGTVEVLWPGGVRNRLRNVEAGETVLLPEIPCSYDGEWASFQAYRSCVHDALSGLIAAGVIDPGDRGPFLSSAIDGYRDTH
jgi:enediyne biosynthesis protein E4